MNLKEYNERQETRIVTLMTLLEQGENGERLRELTKKSILRKRWKASEKAMAMVDAERCIAEAVKRYNSVSLASRLGAKPAVPFVVEKCVVCPTATTLRVVRDPSKPEAGVAYCKYHIEAGAGIEAIAVKRQRDSARLLFKRQVQKEERAT